LAGCDPQAVLRASVIVLAVLALAGCGSESVHQLPPAAEPRDSPALTERPAGRVVRVGAPLAQLTAGRTAEPGGAPEGIVVSSSARTVAVGLRRPSELALLDSTTGRVRKRVRLPSGPRHLAADGGLVFVPAETAGQLLSVDATSGRIAFDVDVGTRPHGVAVIAGGGVIVGDEEGNAIALVEHGTVVARRRVATQPGGIGAAGDGRAVAVVSVRERELELYSDDRRLRRLGRAPAGVGPTHAVAMGDLVWVVDTQGDALLVFRLRPMLQLVRRVRLAGGPYGIALDPVRRRLWVTLTGTNELVELPAHGRPHILTSVPTVRQPNDVAVDSRTGRVFVAGRADGVVQLYDPPGP
jgi:DNA-binding beta-propeller fold protein YncE/predicted small lipoprotein YifL